MAKTDPDMSWWCEGLFIAAIFPPLIPTRVGAEWSVVALISFGLIGALIMSAVILTTLPDTRLKGRLKAVLGGTTVGTLLLAGSCMTT